MDQRVTMDDGIHFDHLLEQIWVCDEEGNRADVGHIRTPGGVDGGQVHAWIARHRPELASRVVFITGDIANEETVATLRQTGAPCVEKPFRVQQFIDVVSKTFGKAE